MLSKRNWKIRRDFFLIFCLVALGGMRFVPALLINITTSRCLQAFVINDGAEENIDQLPEARERATLPYLADNLKYLLQVYPDSLTLHHWLSLVYIANEDWLEAAEHLEWAVELAPSNPILSWKLGLTYEQLALMRDDLDLNVNIRSAWLEAGMSDLRFVSWGDRELRNGNIQRAITWYERALILSPDSGAPWYALSALYADVGNIEKAEAALEQAKLKYQHTIEVGKANRDIWYGLGQVYEASEAWKKALEAYENGLKSPAGQIGISVLYYRIGWLLQYAIVPSESTEALEAYTYALTYRDFSEFSWLAANAYLNRGRIFVELGDLDSARRDYEQAISYSPDYYWPYMELSDVLLALGKKDEAEEQALYAMELAPEKKNAYRLLADLYQQEGDSSSACRMYLRILELDPQDKSALKAVEDLDNCESEN